jgi:phosphatidylserine/phosphatidylglycerophosphate/cardiolipin synthase-like enzyme
MRLARQAIFFLAFYPAQSGKDCIIGEAIDIGRLDGQLLVMGAVSSAQAMPNYVRRDDDDDDEDEGDDDRPAVSPATFFENNVSIVRASRIEDKGIVGDFGREVLTAGGAIIHDKILVIDPLSDDCSVVLGSHNLGYKASYSNDENMMIVSGHRALAEAYMVHVLDVYEHYRFRAVQAEIEAQGRTGFSGFLDGTDRWQDPYLSGSRSALAKYLSRTQ